MTSRRKRVLLAEDDREMREVVRQVLETLGLEVEEASSGVALVSCLVDDGAFDLVVTDVRMPWLSGMQVITKARAAGFEVPVLIMTAFADDELRGSVRKIGGALLLEKPFDMRELIAHARQILGIDSASGLS